MSRIALDVFVPLPTRQSDRRPWRRRRTCADFGPVCFNGPWEDIGQGSCQRCSVERRLYRPNVLPELAVCSKCSQVYANSVLAHRSDEEEAA